MKELESSIYRSYSRLPLFDNRLHLICARGNASKSLRLFLKAFFFFHSPHWFKFVLSCRDIRQIKQQNNNQAIHSVIKFSSTDAIWNLVVLNVPAHTKLSNIHFGVLFCNWNLLTANCRSEEIGTPLWYFCSSWFDFFALIYDRNNDIESSTVHIFGIFFIFLL